MRQFDYIVMRDDSEPTVSPAPDYSKSPGELRLERQIYADKGGELAHFLSLVNPEDAPLVATDIKVRTIGSSDPQLDVLDNHWANLKEEVHTITEEAGYYYFAKTGKTESAATDAFIKHTLITVSGHLLSQNDLQLNLLNGEEGENDYPITSLSQRLDAMREVASHTGITFDAFEKAIDRLSTRTYEAADRFDDILNGYTKSDEEEAEKDDESWRTPESSAEDAEPDWRPATEEDLEDAQELSEEEIEDIPDYNPEHDDCNEGGLATSEREPWEDDDHDDDDDRDEGLKAEMEDYVNYMVDFTNVANQIWMNAATRVTDGGHVELERDKVKEMREIMQHTQEAYDIFKARAEDLGTSSYEMKPVFEALEDPQKGTQAMMQKIISMASRPKHMEEAIKKVLPKDRGKE